MRDTRARFRRVAWGSATCGAAVTLFAVGFFIPLLGDAADRWRLLSINAPLIAVYLLLSGLLVDRVCDRRIGRTMGWLCEGRPPTEAEHRGTLRVAFGATRLDAAAWIIAALGFGVLNGLVQSWELAVVVAITIWLGGETTCALGYLLYERTLRPLTAQALIARPPERLAAPGVRARLTMAWLLGTGVPLVGLLAVDLGATAGWVGGHSRLVGAAGLFLALVAGATGYLATVLAARAIADPLRAVQDGVERISRGDLDAHVEIDDASEVGLLQAGFNRMAEGLRERRRIRDLFGRHVGEDVARAALREGVRLGGEEREVAALFVDLVDSTGLTMRLGPSEVVSILNRFFCVVIEVVEEAGGLVNKFEGDAALCVFGAPVVSDDAAGAALKAARQLAGRLTGELPGVDFGIGVSAGVAVAGNVGSEQRFEYTVIGDPVNEAARLAELARRRPERVLASQAALDRSADVARDAWRISDAAVLRGRGRPTRLASPRSP